MRRKTELGTVGKLACAAALTSTLALAAMSWSNAQTSPHQRTVYSDDAMTQPSRTEALRALRAAAMHYETARDRADQYAAQHSGDAGALSTLALTEAAMDAVIDDLPQLLNRESASIEDMQAATWKLWGGISLMVGVTLGHHVSAA